MKNYFNELTLTEKLAQLGQARLMKKEEFQGGVKALEGKKIAVQGVGHVGEYLVSHLAKEGAIITITDIDIQ